MGGGPRDDIFNYWVEDVRKIGLGGPLMDVKEGDKKDRADVNNLKTEENAKISVLSRSTRGDRPCSEINASSPR